MKVTMTSETYRFVAEVCKREYLWNRKKLPWNETRRKIADKQWDEICKVCNMSKPQAKTKWKGLRGSFYRKLEQFPIYSCGDTYFMDKKLNTGIINKMNFLLKTFKPKPSQKIIEIKDDSYGCIKRKTTKESSPPQTTAQSINSFQSTDTTFPRIETVFTLPPDNDTNTDEIQFIDSPTPLDVINPQTADPQFKSIKKIYTVEKVRGNLMLSDKRENCSPRVLTDMVDLDDSDKRENCSSRVLTGMVELDASDKRENCSPRVLTGMVELDASDKRENCSPSVLTGMVELDASDSELNLNGESTDENHNLSFFRSLLPFMDEMDPMQQLRVRMRIQEMVYEELKKL